MVREYLTILYRYGELDQLLATMSNNLCLETSLGNIELCLRSNSAPKAVEHIKKLVSDGLYNGCCFYRSDFVIQCGLQRQDGSSVKNPYPSLDVNETSLNVRISNKRGTVSVAHWDVPDCGNSEFFINLQENPHLDSAYGGYCVFAEVANRDSYRVVDAIAAAIPKGEKPLIKKMFIT